MSVKGANLTEENLSLHVNPGSGIGAGLDQTRHLQELAAKRSAGTGEWRRKNGIDRAECGVGLNRAAASIAGRLNQLVIVIECAQFIKGGTARGDFSRRRSGCVIQLQYVRESCI